MKLTYHQREEIKRIVNDLISENAAACGLDDVVGMNLVELEAVIDEIEKALS